MSDAWGRRKAYWCRAFARIILTSDWLAERDARRRAALAHPTTDPDG